MAKLNIIQAFKAITSSQWKVIILIVAVNMFLDMVSMFGPMRFKGATCGYVKYDDKMDGNAEVAVRLNRLAVGDNYDASKLKFPVLIFKYTDRDNFTNIPTVDELMKYYETEDKEFEDDLVDINNGMFNLQLAEGRTLNEKHIYNDYLVLYNSSLKGSDHMRASFKVERSGLYCAYVATPAIDDPKRAIMMGVSFKNSFGDMSYYSYMLSTQLKYFVIIGAVLAVFLNYYLRRFQGKEEGVFSQKSIAVLPYGITRMISSKVILDSVLLLLFNVHSLNSAMKNMLLGHVSFMSKLIEIAAYTLLLYMALGFGTIFMVSVNHKKMDPIHSYISAFCQVNYLLWMKYIYRINVVETSVFSNGLNSHFVSRVYADRIYSLVFIILEASPFIWLILTVLAYFSTKKRMLMSGDTQYLKSIKYSILFLLVSPFICTSVTSIVFNRCFVKQLFFGKLYYLVPSILKGSIVYFDLLNTSVSEARKLDPSLNLASIWSLYLTIYANVVFLFFIWIKDNKGLLVTQEIEEEEEAKYESLDDAKVEEHEEVV